jgi:hypothetical protein
MDPIRVAVPDSKAVLCAVISPAGQFDTPKIEIWARDPAMEPDDSRLPTRKEIADAGMALVSFIQDALPG